MYCCLIGVILLLLLPPAVRQLEAWAKGELLGLTSKVKAVLAGCAAHQQQVNLQVTRAG
jgi:hypothetical protein